MEMLRSRRDLQRHRGKRTYGNESEVCHNVHTWLNESPAALTELSLNESVQYIHIAFDFS